MDFRRQAPAHKPLDGREDDDAAELLAQVGTVGGLGGDLDGNPPDIPGMFPK